MVPHLSNFLIYAVLFTLTMLAVNTIEPVTSHRYFNRYSMLQLREKPRATRGFKSMSLSTARGFGKRDSSFRAQEIDSSPRKIVPNESFPVDWLTEEMQNDSELIRTFIRKFVDTNQDNEITVDELFPQDSTRRKKESNNVDLGYEE